GLVRAEPVQLRLVVRDERFDEVAGDRELGCVGREGGGGRCRGWRLRRVLRHDRRDQEAEDDAQRDRPQECPDPSYPAPPSHRRSVVAPLMGSQSTLARAKKRSSVPLICVRYASQPCPVQPVPDPLVRPWPNASASAAPIDTPTAVIPAANAQSSGPDRQPTGIGRRRRRRRSVRSVEVEVARALARAARASAGFGRVIGWSGRSLSPVVAAVAGRAGLSARGLSALAASTTAGRVSLSAAAT